MGVPVGTGASYTTPALTSNSTVYCIMTSSSSCAVPATASSSNTTITISPSVAPSIIISPPISSSICTGQTVAFTATPTNGGNNPTYQWFLNGGLVGTGASYTTPALTSNSTVYCILTSSSSCAVPPTASSSITTITISPSVTPSVIISPSTSTTTCSGQTITFTPTPTNGGDSPSYQWFLNGVLVGTGASYTTPALTSNSTVYCILTSSSSCAVPPTASSSITTITISPSVTPSVIISPSTSTTICSGQTVTFTPMPTNGGDSPSYQWFLNGVPVGTGASYITPSLTSNSIVYCTMTSSLSCANPSEISSPGTSINISTTTAPEVIIAPSSSIEICSGGSVSFIATPSNGGTNPVFQWFLNGIQVASGSPNANFTLTSNSTVYCVMTSQFKLCFSFN